MIYQKKYFGTDGIRGRVGVYPINVDFVLKLGWAVGKVMGQANDGKVLIGKDTRLSGYMFESALEAGLSAAGMDVYLLGPIPTPAIAYLTHTFRAQIGIVISASHNHYLDNGIKFFSSAGLKLKESIEEAIELAIDQPLSLVDASKVGKVYRLDDAPGRYIEFCKSSITHHTTFKGMKIVLDCANGATYSVAPQVFSELEADVIPINVSPNGTNINENCGSLYPEMLKNRVLQEKADVGIAFDGDGDRVIMVDHLGEVVDGDELLFIIAKFRLDKKKLLGGIVGTQMTNLGLEIALKNSGIAFKRTAVGDQHVLHELIKSKWFLGGESSGHIMCLDKTMAADGIISALQVLKAMRTEGKSLHELKLGMKKLPQALISVPCKNGDLFLKQKNIKKLLKQCEDKLQKKGRILLRASGTEPVIRVMIEGEDSLLIQQLAQDLADHIKQEYKTK